MSYLVPRARVRSKRRAVIFLFIMVSAIVHGILLALLFFAYHYDTVISHITLHKDIPLIKFVPGSAAKMDLPTSVPTQVATNAIIPTEQKSNANTLAEHKEKSKEAVATKPLEKIEPLDKSPGTRAALISESQKKKVQKKPSQQKNKKKEVTKNKKDTKSKQVKEKKDPAKPQPPKEIPVEKKIEEPKPIESKDKVIESKEPEQKQIAHNEQVPNTVGSEIAQECLVTMGEVIDDPKLLQYYTQLQNAVSDTWKPPVGISNECICDVLVALDTQGKTTEVKVVKSSGVLIYDLAARNALQEAKMPKWTYGKTITISFKQ